MISVLICSKDAALAKSVTENIDATIGVTHELLIYDNSTERKGICEIYNLLAERAQYGFLCFVHEDVIFTDKNWGNVLVETFNRENAGMMGIAGSKFKSQYYSGWYTNNPSMDCAIYTHQYPDYSEEVILNPQTESMFQEVVCIDGVFMACKKSIWEKIRFDIKISGFHFYDIDFSLRASKECRVGVIFNLHLIHITSGGDYGDKWVQSAIQYHTYYQKNLPYSKWNVSFAKMNRRVIIGYLDFLKNYKISFTNKCRWIFKQRLFLNPLFWVSILKFFLYQPLGLKKILRKQVKN